jgi:phytoene desaturase
MRMMAWQHARPACLYGHATCLAEGAAAAAAPWLPCLGPASYSLAAAAFAGRSPRPTMAAAQKRDKHAVVIGAGFAGLSSACCLAQAGWKVTVLEKNDDLGGRCRMWSKDGYTFDLGPSWYWMPEVFDNFFARFGKKVSDYYELRRLDPPYKVFFQDGKEVSVPDDMTELEALFEQREQGAAAKLRAFLAQAAYKYKVGMGDYVWKPSIALLEFLDPRLLVEVVRLQMLSSQRSHVEAHFRDPTLVQLMEWPVLFLGGSPQNIPAMYSMMNHAAIVGGTWWPKGGMSEIPVRAHTESRQCCCLSVCWRLRVCASVYTRSRTLPHHSIGRTAAVLPLLPA